MIKKLVWLLMPLMLFLFASGPAGASATEAGISASSRAKADVSVEIWPKKGLFGYVKSGRRSCEAGRLVRVFKKVPGQKLRPIGRGRTSKSDRGFTWSLRSRKATSGTVVVLAPGSRGCAWDAVRKQIPPTSGEYPACPSMQDICRLDQFHVSSKGTFEDKLCPIWGKFKNGRCKSEVVSGRVPICCFTEGYTDWKALSSTRRELFMFFHDLHDFGKPEINGPAIGGWVPDDRSAKFFVGSFKIPGFTEDPDAGWFTPEIMDAPPATPGGPLYLNWDAGMDNSFDYYIRGYLYKKPRK